MYFFHDLASGETNKYSKQHHLSILILMVSFFKYFEKLTNEEEYNFSHSLKQKRAKW
jgi:hypothetical protein